MQESQTSTLDIENKVSQLYAYIYKHNLWLS